jgi:hypothetical protein
MISFRVGGVPYHWKTLNERSTSIRGLHTKLWAPKLWESQFQEFQNSHFGVPGQNDIWVLAPWLGTENIIRGKVVASPNFGSWWVLWVHVYSWFIYTPKVLQVCTNQLVVCFVQLHVSKLICLSLFIVLILKLQHTLLPPECCKLGSAPQLFLLPLFSPLDSQLSPLRSLGVCHYDLLLDHVFREGLYIHLGL